ncbi:MAG: carboxypeptidase-like regulatory domain-containing protein, partial [Melioribacteraceae bacterium]
MKKIIILSLFLCFEIFPQIKNIKGIVFDSDSRMPLQSANIIIKGTNIGTSTDENGLFSLEYNFSDSSIIVIS